MSKAAKLTLQLPSISSQSIFAFSGEVCRNLSRLMEHERVRSQLTDTLQH